MDILKGFLICSVVIGHCISNINSDKVMLNVLLISIYTVHMPMFFILSGYVLNVNKKTDYHCFVIAKLKKLMIPYFVFVVIDTVIEVFMHVYSIDEVCTKLMAEYRDIFLITTKSPFSSLWFLPTLYIAILFVYGIKKIINNKDLRIMVSATCIIVSQITFFLDIELDFMIREALMAQFFVFLGCEYKELIKRLVNINNIVYLVLLLLVWLFAVYEWVIDGHTTTSYWKADAFPLTWSTFIACIASICLLIFVGMFEKTNIGFKYFFEYIGQNSIYIYGFHYIFLRFFSKYVLQFHNVWFGLCMYVFCCFFCTLLFMCFYKSVVKSIYNIIVNS